MFDPAWLYHPYFTGCNLQTNLYPSFGHMVYKALHNLGIPSEFVKNPRYEPPFGHTREPYLWSKFKRVDKNQMRKDLCFLTVLEPELFEDSAEEDLVRVEHVVEFPWSCMEGYFIEDLVSKLLEELGVPKRASSPLARLYATGERLRGRLDLKKVAQEIQGLLKKINPEGTTIIVDSNRETDIFGYEKYIFYLERRKNLGSQIYETTHEVGYPVLYWGLVLANAKERKPIGYTILKNEERKKLVTGLSI